MLLIYKLCQEIFFMETLNAILKIIMIYLYWQFPKSESSCLMKWFFSRLILHRKRKL